ncbi:MAG: protein translocase SEC61 complex subunit gamma [Candidatus Micrarchaeota archaeon]
MGIVEIVSGFLTQSQRVIAITHKPRMHEFRQMALTTAIGMVIIGLIGFAITMIALFLNGGF